MRRSSSVRATIRVHTYLSDEGPGGGKAKADPHAPDESNDEEDNLVTSERRDRQDDEHDDRDDPGPFVVGDGILVRLEPAGDVA